MKREMDIDVAGIPEVGGVDLDWSLDARWFRGALGEMMHRDESRAEGTATLHVSRSGRTVQVSGALTARFSVPCVRCLEPAEVAVQESVFMVYEPASAQEALPEEMELTESDLSWETYTGPTLDLSDLLREQILLQVPMRPLCRPDCPGIAYDSGAGEEAEEVPGIDPRWKALAKMVKKD